jgi:Na+/proline symporter
METKVAWVFVSIMIYWAYCIFWGVKGAQHTRTAADYFVAGGDLPGWLFIFAATGTCYSAGSFLGAPGLIYIDGLPYTPLITIAIPLAGALFLKRQWLLGRCFGFITPGEMLAYYFDSQLVRLLVVAVALSFSVPYLGVQLRAAGFLLEVLTDGLVNIDFGMWLLATVLMSYVASGGLRTAAYVDILRTPLLAAGIALLGILVLYLVGGWGRFIEGVVALSQADPSRTPEGYSHYIAIPGPIQLVRDGHRAVGSPWTGSMSLTFLLGLMGIMASPAFSMWALASKSTRGFAPQHVWASAFGIGLIFLLFTAIQGLGGHFLGADQAFLKAHPELVNPVLVRHLNGQDLMALPPKQEALVPELINLMSQNAPWLVGLLAVCALAAMESTASCYMATAGAFITRDLLKPFVWPRADDRTQVFVGRMMVALVVFVALVVATTTSDALVPLAGLAISYGFQMVPALVAVCYWPFLTRQGVACGLVAGLVVVTLTEGFVTSGLGIAAWGRWPLTIHAGVWGIFCNFAIAISLSLFTRDNAARKMEFHSFLRQQVSLSLAKRRLVLLAWAMTILWFCFAAGPGAVVGNWIFGNPNDPSSWWLGMPSIWVWQFLGWVLGIGLIWFLAYHMEMAIPSQQNLPLEITRTTEPSRGTCR